MITPPLFDDISTALSHLDDLASVTAIAEYLTGLGIKATPGECGQCAVAVFLMETVRDLDGVWVNPCEGHGDVEECLEEGTIKPIPMPAPVNEFAMAFDKGHYPELVIHNT